MLCTNGVVCPFFFPQLRCVAAELGGGQSAVGVEGSVLENSIHLLHHGTVAPPQREPIEGDEAFPRHIRSWNMKHLVGACIGRGGCPMRRCAWAVYGKSLFRNPAATCEQWVLTCGSPIWAHRMSLFAPHAMCYETFPFPRSPSHKPVSEKFSDEHSAVQILHCRARRRS